MGAAELQTSLTIYPSVTIELYADVACPWCYIGEARLGLALAEQPELQVTRVWRPFQLQPGLPPAGVPWRTFAEHKFGGWAQALRTFEAVAAVGHEVGLTFDLEGVKKANNTADAHRLILLAQAHGVGVEAAHALFAAYFENRGDLSDPAELARVASSVGLNPDDVAAYLAGDGGRAQLDESQHRAAELGISSVPFFVFNGVYGLSGAQPLEVFKEALRVSDAPAGVS